MSETDEQFLDSMEQWIAGSLVFKREHRERLFALARRGAAVQDRERHIRKIVEDAINAALPPPPSGEPRDE